MSIRVSSRALHDKELLNNSIYGGSSPEVQSRTPLTPNLNLHEPKA